MTRTTKPDQVQASKTYKIRYFAILREQRGLSDEDIDSVASTPLELYHELSDRYKFTLPSNRIQVAVNDRFTGMETILNQGDSIVFVPPVAGG